MISFEEYFDIVLEGISPINQVKPSKLGLSNNVQDLPDTKPYGFWIDKHGNFIAVPHQGHTSVAEGLIKKALKLTGQSDYKGQPYGYFFNLGWVRVVTYFYDMKYEMGRPSEIPTTAQKRLMDFMMDFYDLKEMNRS